MKRAWILVELTLSVLLLAAAAQAGPVLKAKPMPMPGPGQLQPIPIPPGGMKPMPVPPPKIVPPPKPLPGQIPKPFIPPGGFKPLPKPPLPKPPVPKPPQPGPKPKHPKHHHPHPPAWTKFVPEVHINVGGGQETTVIERVPYNPDVPRYDVDGVAHPEPVWIGGKAYYPYPGDGGLWVEYRGRDCYVFGGLLYVKVKDDDAKWPFRRIPVPDDLAERLAAMMKEAEAEDPDADLFPEDE